MDDVTYRHCDEYIDDKSQPDCLRKFLRYCRWPAYYQVRAHGLGIKKPPLFADWNRYPKSKKPKLCRVKVVMASRFGDVGITKDLKAEEGYTWRIPVEHLSNFSNIS